MKRTIAGTLLLVLLGAGSLIADDGWRQRQDIRHDEAKIAHDRRELRRDEYRGDYAAAAHERRELRHEYRDVNRDKRDLYYDHSDHYWDRR